MTADEMITHLRGPARQAVNDLIGHYFGTSDKVLASVPADPERDADLIAATAVVEAADHIEALARRVLELEEMIAAEREACARVAINRASDLANDAPHGGKNAEGGYSEMVAEASRSFRNGIRRAGLGIAAAIRARGE